jgi:hypothetical protein
MMSENLAFKRLPCGNTPVGQHDGMAIRIADDPTEFTGAIRKLANPCGIGSRAKIGSARFRLFFISRSQSV